MIADILAASNACARYERERGDVWQTPAELAASGVGDCEDFAIDAWARAKAAGYAARLAMCLRQDADARRSHMVCLIREDEDQWVLDVNADAVCRLSERLDLVVVLEMDDAGVYVRGVRKPVSTVQQWADVLSRMGAGPRPVRRSDARTTDTPTSRAVLSAAAPNPIGRT